MGTPMIWLKIDGRELTGLDIVAYRVMYDITDTEATGRSKAQYEEMYRDPLSAFCNFDIEVFETKCTNPDFTFLMDTVYSMGFKAFVDVEHIDMVGRRWVQKMYIKQINPIEVTSSDGSRDSAYADNINIRFIAQKGGEENATGS